MVLGRFSLVFDKVWRVLGVVWPPGALDPPGFPWENPLFYWLAALPVLALLCHLTNSVEGGKEEDKEQARPKAPTPEKTNQAAPQPRNGSWDSLIISELNVMLNLLALPVPRPFLASFHLGDPWPGNKPDTAIRPLKAI